jgi:outer membrane cobalamin receptor
VSYEYATRLPRPDEVFGDAKQVKDNLDLEPETSHNLNVGPRIQFEETPLGTLTTELNSFLRETDQLIVVLGSDRYFTYQNVYGARSLGVESSAQWSSPNRMFSLDGMLTWQEVRNASSEGTFGDFVGDRIPNRPYLFGSWGGSVRLTEIPGPNDSVEAFYGGRYVNEYFRGWESAGARSSKQVVAHQLTHNVGVTWSVRNAFARVSSTFEIDNVTDARVEDEFGIQRPGRAYYVKVTGDI